MNKKVMYHVVGFWLLATILLLFLVTLVSYMESSEEEKEVLQPVITDSPPLREVVIDTTALEVYEPTYLNSIEVRATFYNPTAAQTDSNPLHTATGFDIDPNDPYKHRIIAISPDVEKKFGFHMGDSVKLEFMHDKANIYDGNYVIEDRMPSQHSRKIDLLVSSDMYMSYINRVIMTKFE